MAENFGSVVLFIVIFLAPYVLSVGIYFLAFRAAYRMQSPVRTLLLYPLIGSALISAAFLIWMQFQWSSMGPTGKTLTLVFLGFYVLLVMVLGFIAAWSVVYVCRFVQELFWNREPAITRWVFFIPAVTVLGFTLWSAQVGVRRSVQLSTAGSETGSVESQQQLLARALEEHDVPVMATLAGNKQTSVQALVRIYDECKATLNHGTTDYRVFHALARNPKTPADILAMLSKAKESSTRTAVAENPSTPETELRRLASDPDDQVRTWLTHNPRLPQDELVRLLEDRDEVVRNHAHSFMEHRGLARDAREIDDSPMKLP